MKHRRNNRGDRGRLVPSQLLGWGTNNVLVSQLFGRSFQKSKTFHSKYCYTRPWSPLMSAEATRMQDLAF